MGGTSPIFDAHLHIIDPAHPLVANHGFVPDPFTFDDYRARIDGLGIGGGAIVSGSFQAFDQGYLLAALKRLGPTYVGVTQLPVDVTDAEVRSLDAAGVRAVRFNLVRGGSAQVADLDRLARRVHDLVGWHSELYLDARDLDAALTARIAALPAASIDHLGMHAEGLPRLLELVAAGVRVKATGFGRVDLDPASAIRAIIDLDPSALMVGTDLPSTRARRPFADADLDLIRSVVPAEHLDQVLWGNAAELYLGGRGGTS